MPTLDLVDTDSLTGKARETIERVQQRSGRIPNMVRLLVNSPAALDAYIGSATALAQGALSPELQALVAVAVTAELGCDYSLAAVSRHRAPQRHLRAGAQHGAHGQGRRPHNGRSARLRRRSRA